MAGSVLNFRDVLRIDRLVYVPVLFLLIGIWTVTIDFKLDTRAGLLATAEDELYGSVDTLSAAEVCFG
jgi:hypothetical protein